MKLLVSSLVALCAVWSIQKDVKVSASIFNMFRSSSSDGSSGQGKVVHPVVEDPHAIRGLPDHMIPLYQKEYFVCDNGKTVLKPGQINDGYCDCKDGKDEPGTSACSHGTFYCRNKGYKIISIPSSRVEDDICDCCDASDELPGSCPNTCSSVASKERASLERAINAFKTGNAQRKGWIAQAKEHLQSQANQLALIDKKLEQLKANQASVTQESDAYLASLSSSRSESLSEAKKTLDQLLILEPENLAYLAQFVQNLAEVLDVTEDQIDNMMTFKPQSRSMGTRGEEEGDGYGEDGIDHASSGAPHTCDVTDLLVTSSVLLSGLCQAPENNDVYAELFHLLHQLLKQYRPYSEAFYLLGHYKLQGNQWVAEAVDYARNALVDNEPHDASLPSDAPSCPADFAALSAEFCLLPEQMKSLLEPLVTEESTQQQDGTYLNYKQTLHTLNNEIRDLERRRTDASSAQDKLAQLANRPSAEVEGELAFQALKDQCFDVVDGKFSYSVCILQRVSQKEEHGNYNTVNLGSYERVETVAPTPSNQGAAYVMHFENGQYCHAHGPRKADVTIRCGEKNVLLSAAEPSTCFYALQFESPVACTDAYAAAQGILPYL
jgi:protein kinase C substrate 80K-H